MGELGTEAAAAVNKINLFSRFICPMITVHFSRPFIFSILSKILRASSFWAKTLSGKEQGGSLGWPVPTCSPLGRVTVTLLGPPHAWGVCVLVTRRLRDLHSNKPPSWDCTQPSVCLHLFCLTPALLLPGPRISPDLPHMPTHPRP